MHYHYTLVLYKKPVRHLKVLKPYEFKSLLFKSDNWTQIYNKKATV